MRILIAFDKFKDSMRARTACAAARRAIEAVCPAATIDTLLLTDGGDGFCEVLTSSANGEYHSVVVRGPRGQSVEARFGLVKCEQINPDARLELGLGPAGRVGILEMAQASGLHLVPLSERDPWKATTYGSGELLRHLSEHRTEAILVGVGGSATNDCGLGALAALGLECFDGEHRLIPDPVPEHWCRLSRIRGASLHPLPPLKIACDVNNPLTGPSGASAVFGPQKGLKAADLPKLDEAVQRVADLLMTEFRKPANLAQHPGTGAAGGISFGLMAAYDADLVPGWDLVCRWLGIDSKLRAADCVITGEGRFDASSLRGKGPGSILREALEQQKQVAVFAGGITGDARAQLADAPNAQLCQITPEGMALEEALRQGETLLVRSVTEWAARNLPR